MGLEKIVVEATNACDMSCVHCVRDPAIEKGRFSLANLEKILEQSEPYGTRLFGFTGGESLLHPGFGELVDAVVARGHSWTFGTNGGSTDKLAKLISDKRRRSLLASIALSLDGAGAETHDRIRKPGAFKALMKTVAYLKGEKIPFGMVSTINALNLPELERMADLASELGARSIDFNHLHPTPDIVEGGLLLSPRKWIEADRRIDRLAAGRRMRVGLFVGGRSPFPFFQCGYTTVRQFYFDFKGDMSVCCATPNYRGADRSARKDVVGNIAETDLWDLHQRLLDAIEGLNRAKLDKIARNAFAETDYYPCIFCLKHFGKLDWLKTLDPDNEWNH